MNVTLKNENLVNDLVEHGADVHKEDDYEITPLVLACSVKQIHIVKILVEHRADINKDNKNGFYTIINGMLRKQ